MIIRPPYLVRLRDVSENLPRLRLLLLGLAALAVRVVLERRLAVSFLNLPLVRASRDAQQLRTRKKAPERVGTEIKYTSESKRRPTAAAHARKHNTRIDNSNGYSLKRDARAGGRGDGDATRRQRQSNAIGQLRQYEIILYNTLSGLSHERAHHIKAVVLAIEVSYIHIYAACKHDVRQNP